MNIQAEKIELIKLITEINSESVLKKIKSLLMSDKELADKDTRETPAMAKRLGESKKQVAEGKGVKVKLDDIWK